MNAVVEGIFLSLMGIALMVIVVLLVTRWQKKALKKTLFQKEVFHIILIWGFVMFVFLKIGGIPH